MAIETMGEARNFSWVLPTLLTRRARGHEAPPIVRLSVMFEPSQNHGITAAAAVMPYGDWRARDGSERTETKPRPPSKYLAAGSPQICFLPSCRKPFEQTCVHGTDGHFYCSQPCSEIGGKIDLTHVEDLRPTIEIAPSPKKKLFRG